MFKLAFKRILKNKVSSFVTLFSIALTVVIFLILNTSLDDYGKRLTARTDAPLLVAGSRGSGVDLIMKSLYFRKSESVSVKYIYNQAVNENATSAPLFIQYTAKQFPICSTSLNYFELRDLSFSAGGAFTKLGDCVLGADVANKLQLRVGDKVITDPDNVFNPAGSLPLEMKIKGILARASSPDDGVIFTSLKTGWTIHGLGHAHPEETDKPDLSVQYIELNEDTLNTFHFHGDQDEYPLTAILLKPNSPQDEAFLLGQSAVSPELAILNPKEGLQSFLKMLFQLDSLFLIILVLILAAISILLTLVFILNLRLRRNEKEIFDRLGMERMFFARLVSAEWLIYLTAGILLGILTTTLLNPLFKQLFDMILRG
jgi:putative ABC transport system permease protein